MIKSERGSITVFTLSACLLMVFILVGVFMGNQNKIINQKRQLNSIEENYSDKDIENEMTQEYEKYSAKIEEDNIVRNVSASKVKINPKGYYGKTVINYESTNGQKDWKIFYSDGEHIFLITSDYLENSKVNTTATGMATDGTYRAWWDSVPSMQTVTDETKTLFMATGYTLNDGYDNSKCVSTLLNTSNWEGFKDAESKAKSAIGSPTVEMWMDSWNNLYKDVDGELFCNNTSDYGYYVGTTSSPTSTAIDASIMNVKKGYNNKLYYPHIESVSDGSNACYGYWLASSSAGLKRKYALYKLQWSCIHLEL